MYDCIEYNGYLNSVYVCMCALMCAATELVHFPVIIIVKLNFFITTPLFFINNIYVAFDRTN